MQQASVPALGSTMIRPLPVGRSLSSMIEAKACSVFPLACKCRRPPQGPPGCEAESWSSLRCPTRTTNTLAFSFPPACAAASACRSGIATAACSLCGQTLDWWDDHPLFGVCGEIPLPSMAPSRTLCFAVLPRISVRSLQSSSSPAKSEPSPAQTL